MMNSHPKERQKQIEYAMASFELEGCIIPEGFKELVEQYIIGKITLREFGDIIRQDIQGEEIFLLTENEKLGLLENLKRTSVKANKSKDVNYNV